MMLFFPLILSLDGKGENKTLHILNPNCSIYKFNFYGQPVSLLFPRINTLSIVYYKYWWCCTCTRDTLV